MITTWYLQSQRTWDKLCHSCIGSSFLPRGAFPEGGAYAVPQRLHAGSLEALRVSRPEAVVLAVNKQPRPEDVVLGEPPEGAISVWLPPLGAWGWEGPVGAVSGYSRSNSPCRFSNSSWSRIYCRTL